METEKFSAIASMYYSRKDVQEAIHKFCLNREAIARYQDSFGKRPDSFEYPSEVFQLVRKGATSFHCSEEIWKNPLDISTELSLDQLHELREGWDLLIDIDSKYLDYSKIMAKLLIRALNFHGIKNMGIKFSVSGDTDVLIKNNDKIGLMPISKAIDLLKKKEKLSVLSLDKNRKLKFSKIYDFLEHEDILYKLFHSQSKIPVKVTSHHSVFIWNNGEIIQKKVSELKTGEYLISFNSKSNPLEQEFKILNKFEFAKNQFSKKEFEKEIPLTPELMRLIGYFLAEGHTTKIINQTGFSFNVKEKDYIKDCTEILSKLTNRKISIRHPNTGSTQILIHSKEWRDFFKEVCGEKKEKHLPPFAWKLPRHLFLEMLKGYIRGDGYKIGEYGIVIKSVSKQLIKEWVWLCKLNNISCSLYSEYNKPHKLPQGTMFKGSFVYILNIPKSELKEIEFNRPRNKFSPFPRDRVFPIDGLKEVYKKIKPKMFNTHRPEQMTLKKKTANLIRIKKVMEWFSKYGSIEKDEECKKIIENYEKLFESDISVVKIKKIEELGKEKVYDVSVEETESFFGNDFPILLHNSGKKGFHLIVPWKAFPKQVQDKETKNMFPEYPRIICLYLKDLIEKDLVSEITKLTEDREYVKHTEEAKEVVPDLVLVSSRHLFRAPYSLHEKTGFASIPINPDKIDSFQPSDADPLKVKITDYVPDVKEGEARELLLQALDWHKSQEKKDTPSPENRSGKVYQEIQIDTTRVVYPPSIKKMLEPLKDGKKRALFVLLNFFRSLGFERLEVEKRLEEWNSKHEKPLQNGYLKGQIGYSFSHKKMLPPNFDKASYYQDLGIVPDQEEVSLKNPVAYTKRKMFSGKRQTEQRQKPPKIPKPPKPPKIPKPPKEKKNKEEMIK